MPIAGLAPGGPVVTTVKFNQNQLRLVKRKTFQLEEGVYYTNVHPAYAAAVTWGSSNSKIATVSGDGIVKAKKSGTVTITATTNELTEAGAKASTSIRITVVAKKPKVKVTKVSASVPTSLKLGQSAYITGSYASAKAAGVKVSYASSNDSVASVDAVGRIVAKNAGTLRITVKAGSKTRTYPVSVG
ncbi:MAG TPA: Ig-like domain-containing protein [Propionicimonas sp.]|nr:Ig-like domain-containing protein [Propionicimonas sp.]HQD95811.1 Ig-like domain-containing protein [Propionicimonas sp.]